MRFIHSNWGILMGLFLSICWCLFFIKQKCSISAALMMHYKIPSHESELEQLPDILGMFWGGRHQCKCLGGNGDSNAIH